jgi:hypothetical protein
MQTASALVRTPEGRVVLALAIAAALRVLCFGLAFPFFSNVDEYRHLDVVVKYSHGIWSTPGPDRYEDETMVLVGKFGSPEYLRDPLAPQRDTVPPPAWRQPDEVVERRIESMRRYLGSRHSLEADQPPVYYATAGAWMALGRAVGLEGLGLLYWVRGLGVVVAFALVVVAWGFLRDLYPESLFVRVGTPLLLASIPQDALYYITGDVFSPLLGGLGLLLVLRLAFRSDAGFAPHAAAGAVLAAAFLDKYPNAAVLVAAAVPTAAALRRDGVGAAGRWAVTWGVVLAPAALWLGRNLAEVGDLTGTAFKVEHLGWGRKSAAELLDHPIFTPGGAWTFVSDMIPRFWRGELVWYQEELGWAAADWVYTISSLVFVIVAALAIRSRQRGAERRLAEGTAAVAVVAGVAVLAGLSLLFVFGEHTSPSAAYPYFVQGRLVSGVLLPFAWLYVRGIEVATARIPGAAWAVLGAVAALAWISEIALTLPVFGSAYNAYHLP